VVRAIRRPAAAIVTGMLVLSMSSQYTLFDGGKAQESDIAGQTLTIDIGAAMGDSPEIPDQTFTELG
jgi:hypothetical protein